MPSKTKEQPESALPKGIGKPATRALASAGISRLDQVARLSEAQLLALHGVGPKAVGVIKAALEAQGKSLARDR
ncbi:helix-hairpin-helix domain-containing protein [Sorangium sp. So ce388]|uniref:helix-hairpin-helix domain-containing protein n=1 Tax=Sorangium sp. So ce388 TaxID=3133309 RepID=UPI003F5BF17D